MDISTGTPQHAAAVAAQNHRLPQEPLFVSTAEVAQVLGVNRTRVTAWCRAGDIPCVRIGKGDYRIPASWLTDLVRQANGGAA